jgi:hypothetical protein
VGIAPEQPIDHEISAHALPKQKLRNAWKETIGPPNGSFHLVKHLIVGTDHAATTGAATMPDQIDRRDR